MSAECLSAHSLVEAFLYFLVTPCPLCQSDRLDPQDATPDNSPNTVKVVGVCRNCGGSESIRFSVDHLPPVKDRFDPISGTHAISLGRAQSKLIDIVQWVTLHEILLEKAKSEPIPAEVRWLRIRAGQCLDEALKFFDAYVDAPPDDAVFAGSSRKRVQAHPERYTRTRLADLRNLLPSENAFDEAQQDDESRRPWWKFW